MPLGITEWENGPNGYNPGNGRVNVACVHPLHAQVIYVGAPSGGLWKSNDGGATWNTTFDNMPHLGVSAIAIHPDSSQVVFAGTGDRDAYDTPCTGLYKSTEGGQQWTISSHWVYGTPGFYTHADIHYLGFSGSRLFCGSDGGLFYSDDNGLNWTDISQGLGITQFYRMASSPIDGNFLVAGA